MKLPNFLEPAQLYDNPAQWTMKGLFHKLPRHPSFSYCLQWTDCVLRAKCVVIWFPPFLYFWYRPWLFDKWCATAGFHMEEGNAFCGPISHKPEHFWGMSRIFILKAQLLLQWKEHRVESCMVSFVTYAESLSLLGLSFFICVIGTEN